MSETFKSIFISFLAIISGVLSEQAHEKFITPQIVLSHRVGENARWEFISEKLWNRKNKTVAEAKYLENQNEVIQDWMDEQAQFQNRLKK